MNLLITTDCNLDCSYCFAGLIRKKRQGALQRMQGGREMTLPELETVLTAMDPERSPVRLMGGEPTLHSKYAEILRSLKSRGYQVLVFTNGTQAVLHRTAPYLPDRVLLNLNDRAFYLQSQRRAIRENMAALGNRVELGYTITKPDFELMWHRQAILDAGLQPTIRLGLAQPVIRGDNDYLPDADLKKAHTSVVLWAKQLSEDGIRLSLDCGFMRCHFTESDIEALIRAGTVLRFECSPTIDVGPGLETWRCYAFTHQKGLNWSDFKDKGAPQGWFAEPEAGLEQACSHCQHRESGWCQGGCLARTRLQV